MTRVLLVDDDPAFVRIYKDGLTRLGFAVEVAGDGVTALSSMHGATPDIVVLDLMMPRLSGQEVLKLMRGQSDLTSVPVIVLSNTYMAELARHATEAGSVSGLLKIDCTPAILAQTIQQVLVDHDRVSAQIKPPVLAEAPKQPELPAPEFLPPPAVSGQPLAGSVPAVAFAQAGSPLAETAHDKEVRAVVREEFLGASSAHCTSLRSLFLAFANATEETRMFRLQDLYRKVHFLTGTAGLAGCHHIGQTAAVFEALLYQLMDQPSRITPSVLRTGAMAIDFIQMLYARAAYSPGDTALPRGRVLVVDDDPVCTRLVLWALGQAHLEAQSAGETQEALRMLGSSKFDLILLDIGLPGMDGIQFCKLLRSMPAHKDIPVIHCTSHTDFQTRTQSALCGGDDFISKPVLPMELALKAVMHLIERQASR